MHSFYVIIAPSSPPPVIPQVIESKIMSMIMLIFGACFLTFSILVPCLSQTVCRHRSNNENSITDTPYTLEQPYVSTADSNATDDIEDTLNTRQTTKDDNLLDKDTNDDEEVPTYSQIFRHGI